MKEEPRRRRRARCASAARSRRRSKLKNVEPRYTDLAREARVSSVVILEAVIGTDGRVDKVKVLRGHPLLNDSAVDAVKQWVYSPTTLNGVAVAVVMTVTVNFKLGASSARRAPQGAS